MAERACSLIESLGTAVGELTAERLDLGDPLSVLLFAGPIALVAAAHLGFECNAVVALWHASILAQPREHGGLGLGVRPRARSSSARSCSSLAI